MKSSHANRRTDIESKSVAMRGYEPFRADLFGRGARAFTSGRAFALMMLFAGKLRWMLIRDRDRSRV